MAIFGIQTTPAAAPAKKTRSRRVCENREFAAFARRIIRAFGRRIAAGDVEALPELVQLQRDIDAIMGDAVKGLKAQGYSWAEIAARTGTTRQGAQQRWAKYVNA